MDDNEIKSRVSELRISIKNANAEIETIQSQCKHPEHHTKDVGANGVCDLKIVCKLCGKVLGYPNKQDLESWMA